MAAVPPRSASAEDLHGITRRPRRYGVAFLSLRVLFNAYLLWRWYGMADAPVRLWPCTLATLALHTTWFVKWCKSYARRRKAKEG